MYADLVLLITAAPDDEDVVAGPIGAAVFFGLILVVALLLWNFTKQLKKVDKARDAGVFGDGPKDVGPDTTGAPDASGPASDGGGSDGGSGSGGSSD